MIKNKISNRQKMKLDCSKLLQLEKDVFIKGNNIFAKYIKYNVPVMKFSSVKIFYIIHDDDKILVQYNDKDVASIGAYKKLRATNNYPYLYKKYKFDLDSKFNDTYQSIVGYINSDKRLIIIVSFNINAKPIKKCKYVYETIENIYSKNHYDKLDNLSKYILDNIQNIDDPFKLIN